VPKGHIFWLFYKFLIYKHKFQANLPDNQDYRDNCVNFKEIFKKIMDPADSSAADIVLPAQWIYDILSEFLYQFQGFCQKVRSNCTDPTFVAVNPEYLPKMRKHNFFDLWSYTDVHSILNSLFTKSGIKDKNTRVTATSSNLTRFGYFACVELARLECLTGDFLASIKVISSLNLTDRSELFTSIPICCWMVYNHLGVSQLMLRRFSDAIDSFSHLTLYISSILKPGASLSGDVRLFITEKFRLGTLEDSKKSDGVVSVIEGKEKKRLHKYGDKITSLAAICHALCPGKRLDDHVRIEINNNSKYNEKLHRLVEGDAKIFKEIFEANCPQFVYPGEADYTGTVNHNQECFKHHIDTFMEEVSQNISVLRLRSYLRLYAAIKVEKLARFSGASDNAIDFEARLVSYKHKAMQMETSITGDIKAQFSSDINFYINDGNVEIFSANKKMEKENRLDEEFISGVRKHKVLCDSLISRAKSVGL